MDPIRQAIFEALSGDTELSDLANGTYHYRAPQGSKRPYVLFSRRSDTAIHSMRDSIANDLWSVKGVSAGEDAEESEDIDARCREVLVGLELEIPDHDHLYLNWETGFDYTEPSKGGDLIYHFGSVYRVMVD